MQCRAWLLEFKSAESDSNSDTDIRLAGVKLCIFIEYDIGQLYEYAIGQLWVCMESD